MNKFTDITKIDWEILNALSDDFESVGQIQNLIESSGSISHEKKNILDRLDICTKETMFS